MLDREYYELCEASIFAAYSPFRSGDDPAADFVLQTSNGVRLWLCKEVVSRASPVFRDMFNIPQPPPAPDADQDGPDSDYVGGKPVVRIAEEANVIDVLIRCSYLMRQRSILPEELTAVYEAGQKYDVDAVRGYARQEVARYALQTEYCVRAYLIAYRFEWERETKMAARQSLNVPKHGLLSPELPEHHTVPASALTKLQNYRKKCLEAVGAFCFPSTCVKYYNYARPPLWDYCPDFENPPDTGCTCDLMAYSIETTMNIWGYDETDKRFAAKEWFNSYTRRLYKALQRDDTSISRALFDPEVIAGAISEVDECDICLKNAPAALAAFLRDINEMIDWLVLRVSFT